MDLPTPDGGTRIDLERDPGPAIVEQVRRFAAEAAARGGGVGDVAACAEASELDPRWLAVLRDGLGHEPYLLLARDERTGRLRGVVGLALVSGVFGRFLVGLPYLNRGGIAAEDAQVADALVERAVRLARQLQVRYLELRHSQPIGHAGLHASRGGKARMVLSLEDSEEGLWQQLRSKVRNQIRRADRHEPTITWGGRELLGAFYQIFSVNMRDLGTPVYPRRLFEAILRHFPQAAELAVARCGGVPAAAALLVHGTEGTTQVPSASSLRRFNPTCINMWMYHRMLVRAVERGAGQFDFGRSTIDSGTYRFKQQWGARPLPTTWQLHLCRGAADAVRPESGRYDRWIGHWQKLPVWVTRMVGPVIVRGIP